MTDSPQGLGITVTSSPLEQWSRLLLQIGPDRTDGQLTEYRALTDQGPHQLWVCVDGSMVYGHSASVSVASVVNKSGLVTYFIL